MIHLLSFLLIVGFAAAPIAARTQQPDATSPTVARDTDGEVTSAVFDDLTSKARLTNATVFVLSRLGRREHSKYNYRRLHNALQRFADYHPGKQAPRVVGAIGERTTSTGVVEVYLDGTLFYVVKFEHNRDFTVDCCWLIDEPPPREYFPHYRGQRKFNFP